MLKTNLNDARRQATMMTLAGVDRLVINHFTQMITVVDRYMTSKSDYTMATARRTVESVHNELGYHMNSGKTPNARTSMTMACIITAAIKKDLANEVKTTSPTTNFVAKRTENSRLAFDVSMAYDKLTKYGYDRMNLSSSVRLAMTYVESAIKSACALKTDAAVNKMKNEIASALRCISRENCSYTMEMYNTKAFLQRAANM